MIQFTIKGEIKTKQRPRATVIGGHARVYSSKDTIMYENYVKSEYQRQCAYYFNGNEPLKATITAYFLPSNELAKYGQDVKYVACMKNKDLDNIAKTILDALNGIAYEDDKQIVELHVEKYYTPEATEYVEVKIETLVDDFITLDYLKEKSKLDKLVARYCDLLTKQLTKKLTSAEKKRLAELKEILLSEGRL
jgi:Holliday junction resolvase RusA-like endonuclease